MNRTNYHTHNSMCDGEGDIEEYIEAAIDLGFLAIGFSSHAPIPFENEWTLKMEDLPLYMRRLEEAKAKYGEKIQIYRGLEVDFIPGYLHPREKWISELELDFIIGSVHFLPTGRERPEFLTVDGPDEEFLELLEGTHRGSVPSLVGDYYHHLREMIRIGGFDILGHIDLIKKKNTKLKYLDESEAWYRNELLRSISVLKDTGIIMEINTGGIARGATERPYPSDWALSEAVKLDIPITLSSDAHHPGKIDCFFAEATEMAKNCGVTAFRQLIDGEWRLVSL